MKRTSILYVMMLLIFGLISCNKDEKGAEAPIQELKVETLALNILEGETKDVKIISGNPPYQLTLDNDNITATEKNGVILIEGVTLGTSVITLTDSKNKKQTIKVEIASFTLDKNEVTIEISNTTSFVTILSGSGTYQANSDNLSVLDVTIEANKVQLIPKAKGQATVTVTDTKTNKQLTIVVVVYEPIPADHYQLSSDGTILVKWLKDDTTEVNMELDPVLSQVKTLGRRAFSAKLQLTSVVLPQGLKTIEEEAFSSCRELLQITIPNGVDLIGDGAFQTCRKLTSITLPEQLNTLGEYAFSECNELTSIVVPNSVTRLKEGLFSKCNSLQTIQFSDQLEAIEDLVFNGCIKLNGVVLPETITSIGISAFADCRAFTTIVIPSKVTSLSSSLFSGCTELNKVTLGAGIQYVGNKVFENCIKLNQVTFPATVVELGEYVFKGCTTLHTITFESSNVPDLYANFFSDVENNIPLQHIYVPSASQNAYETAWTQYASLIKGK